jgi:hypothetical protein
VEDPIKFDRCGDDSKSECRMLNPAMAGNIEYRSDESLRFFFFYQRMAISTFMYSIFDPPSLRLWPDKYWIFQRPPKGRLEPTRSRGGDSVIDVFPVRSWSLFRISLGPWDPRPLEPFKRINAYGDDPYSMIWFLVERDSPAEMTRMAGLPLTGHLFSQIPQPVQRFKSTWGNFTFNCFPPGPSTQFSKK